ncbi:hypothetical protein TNCV_4178161 [Trichonephila clavipes]|nr:hypothetical protein TNCV_4178161 [Trichonephila clavipes]
MNNSWPPTNTSGIKHCPDLNMEQLKQERTLSELLSHYRQREITQNVKIGFRKKDIETKLTFTETFEKVSALLDCSIVLLEEFVAVVNNIVCSTPVMMDRDIQEFDQSSNNIVVTDCIDENEMNYPDPTSSEMKNLPTSFPVLVCLREHLDWNAVLLTRHGLLNHIYGSLMLPLEHRFYSWEKKKSSRAKQGP